jgi:hypothetical protein
MWRRLGVASPRCARARTACASSWPCTMGMIIFACLMPAYASLWRSLCPPTVQARRRRGGRVHRRWRRGSRIGSGRYVRCYCIACHRGHSPRRCKRGGSRMDVRVSKARCAYEQGQRPAPGLGNPMGEVITVRLMARGRLQTGLAELSAGLRYTTHRWAGAARSGGGSCSCPLCPRTCTRSGTPREVWCWRKGLSRSRGHLLLHRIAHQKTPRSLGIHAGDG